MNTLFRQQLSQFSYSKHKITVLWLIISDIKHTLEYLSYEFSFLIEASEISTTSLAHDVWNDFLSFFSLRTGNR